MEYNREEIIQYYKNKYKHISEIDIEIMYDCAYDVLFNLRYPTHNTITEIPQSYLDKHKTWIFRCIQDHISKEGMDNVLSYSENGVSVTFDKAGVSMDLIKEIVPVAKMGVVNL